MGTQYYTVFFLKVIKMLFFIYFNILIFFIFLSEYVFYSCYTFAFTIMSHNALLLDGSNPLRTVTCILHCVAFIE